MSSFEFHIVTTQTVLIVTHTTSTVGESLKQPKQATKRTKAFKDTEASLYE